MIKFKKTKYYLKSDRSIKEMDLNDKNLIDLNGIEEFTNLEILYLGRNLIKNLKPLSNLHKLKQLYLHYNDFNSLKYLEKLTNLESLTLTGNYKIKNFKYLENLTNLTRLTLDATNITNIDFLFKLKKLNKLRLDKSLLNTFGIDTKKLNTINDIQKEEAEILKIVAPYIIKERRKHIISLL